VHSLKNQFLTTLHKVLQSYPQGISEYALIQHLKDMQQPLFVQANLRDTLSLFRTHFVLFHALYLLRDRLRNLGEFDLQISPLQIRLAPAAPTSQQATHNQALERDDPLRSYYLNLEHLQATDRADVDALLKGSRALLLQPQSVTDALLELGIAQPLSAINATQLRHQYRKLVSAHHPDRGGCTERLQRINQAMDTLRAAQLLS